MKLNRKFSLIVIITIIQVVFLTIFSFSNTKKIQQIKEYQITQTKTQVQLGNIIDYLDNMDFWGFDLSTAYSEFAKNKKEIEALFNYQFENPLNKTFPENFNSNLKQIKGIWQLLCDYFSPVESILQQMEASKVNQSIALNIKYYGIRDTFEESDSDEELDILLSLTTDAHEDIKKIRKQYESLNNVNAKSNEILEEILQEKERQFIFISILIAAISCIILSVLILLVTTGISKRIVKIRNMTSTLSEKDFTVEIKPEGSDEMYSLMENINNMVLQVNDFFTMVKATASKAINSGSSIIESANSTALATNQIDKSIDDINKEFNEVIKVIQNVVGVIADMNNHVDTLVKSNSKQTIAIEDSNNAVSEVVGTLGYMNSMAMERVKVAEEMHNFLADGDNKISSTNQILNEVAQDLDEVYEVVEIINNVAEQTNLLSMNAAIESAHAGDAGKGFSVVAEEIRSLAEETSENATKISSVINKIVSAVGSANDSSRSASEAFIKVSSHADQIVSSLQEISSGIDKIDNQMKQIRKRSEETASAADEINTYCGTLAEKQSDVSSSVDMLNSKLFGSIQALHDIKVDTADIVNKMSFVTNASDSSYKNMTELETVLEDFKTKVIEVQEEIEEVSTGQIDLSSNNEVENVIEELEEEL